MAATSTRKKSTKAPADGIDPRSDAIVLRYVEGRPTPRYVAGRDLHGGDLAKVAYRRALEDQQANRQVLVKPGEELPEPTRPRPATPRVLGALFEELVATRAFKPAPAAAAETPPEPSSTPEPPADTEAPA